MEVTPWGKAGRAGRPVLHFALLFTSLDHHECNADWRRHRQNLAGGRQVASLLIDFEDHDVIAGLIGGQQVAAAGRDFKVARGLAAGGDVFQ
jgi:hypothetical protein